MRAQIVDRATRDRAVAAARGDEPFDLLLTGGTVLDVGTCELRRADVGLVGSLIASVHDIGARREATGIFDVGERYVAPGFIDVHMHFESSMLTPRVYAEAVSPRGTTTVFADPHELANVAGLDGVRYAIDASRGLPVRFLFQAPSCVPPVPGLELSAADFTESEIKTMLGWPEVHGVAEVMDMLGVLRRSDRMVEIVDQGIRSGALVSGHAHGLAGHALQAYATAGITSDHELSAQGDLLARLRAGLTVELRGAYEFLLGEVVEVLNGMPVLPVHVAAATDDLFARTLLTDGGIDHLLRRLVRLGMDPVRAIRMATYHSAYRLQRQDLGFVGPGRLADLVVLSDLDEMVVDDVFFEGRHVASGDRMLEELREATAYPPLHTLRMSALEPSDFLLRLPGVPDGTARLRVVAGAVFTHWSEVEVTVRDELAELPPGFILQAAIHRHGRVPARPVLAVVSGWGNEWSGAIATTVSHDSHNLVVFGRDPVDMAVAANAVIDSEGGVAVASGGRVLERIELPIGGILSPLSAPEVAEAQANLERAALSIGLASTVLSQPLFQVMTASLPCLPGPHVTDLGLADGTTGELITSLLIQGRSGARL
jgi:adenine deaminase